ncbi:MAG: aminoglycoside phosphotransferase family protein [Actinomycetota bacterium]
MSRSVPAPIRGGGGTGERVDVTEALSGRAGLEGVRWLLLAPAVRRSLRRELSALLPSSELLGPCRLYRAKFKPGRKLKAYYNASLGNVPGNFRSVAVEWVPDALGDVGPDAGPSEMEAEAIDAGLAAPFQRLQAGDHKLGTRISVSPLDPRYRQLVRVSTPEHARAMVARACSGGGAAHAGGPVGSYAVTTIRYRPGERHVLRYDPVDDDGARSGEGTIFAKLYRDGEGARAWSDATQIADWLEPTEGIQAARPLGYLPDDEVILYPRVTGTPLSNFLRRARGTAAVHLERAGAALRHLHETPVELTGKLPRHEFAAEIKAIARASEHVEPLLPSASEGIARLLERAQEVEGKMVQEAPTFAHGDYKADHAWVTAAGLTLIDFNTVSLAEPALDVGKFLADLQWWYATSGRSGVEWARERFLAGYGADTPPQRLLSARLYEVLILTKITVRRVRLFDPAWAPHTEALIARADALLDDLCALVERGGRASEANPGAARGTSGGPDRRARRRAQPAVG